MEKELSKNTTAKTPEKQQIKNKTPKTPEKQKKLQWHPAFCSALRLELLEDSENLEFTDEFQLTEKPLQIDCTVVKVKKNCRIKNEIGKIFRTHNIFEYKSPKDELNIDTFYKAVAYACLYKVLPKHVNEIPADELTVTLLRDRKPVKLLHELKQTGYGCQTEASGIYYVSGVMFPMQIIVSSELDTNLHVQLKALTDQLDKPLIRRYLEEASVFTEREKSLADVVLQVIVGSNMEKFQEWKGSEQTMCEALRVLMKEELKAERAEGQLCAYASLVQDGIITVEMGAKKAGLSIADFTREMKQAGYVIPSV